MLLGEILFGGWERSDSREEMAPQVGLESTLKRIFNNMQVSG
jgi:hypothetical protein